jgi:hypothetical protein
LATGFAGGHDAPAVLTHFEFNPATGTGNVYFIAGIDGNGLVSPLGNHEVLATNRTSGDRAATFLVYIKSCLTSRTMNLEHYVASL